MLIFSGFQVQVAVTLSRDILTVDPPLTRPHHFTMRHFTTRLRNEAVDAKSKLIYFVLQFHFPSFSVLQG
jgi:hypothetical protein